MFLRGKPPDHYDVEDQRAFRAEVEREDKRNLKSDTFYREFVWTPTLIGSTGGTATTTGAGRGTKIGRLVHLQGDVTASDVSSLTGEARIGGLPYPAHGTDVGRVKVHLSSVANVTGHDQGTLLGTFVRFGESEIRIAENDGVAIAVSVLTNTSGFSFYVTYEAAS